MTFPNLVIGGAPKCGTSSVFRWVADHPDTLPSSPKETFFLLDEEHPLLNTKCNVHSDGLESYGSFFEGDDSSATCVFEATTHYLYSDTAREVLSELNPIPKIVFILRNPADRIYSSFRYTKNNLARIEDDISFRQYIEILEGDVDREIEEIVHSQASAYVAKRELQYSRYVDYLTGWLDTFGSENVELFLFENMVEDHKHFMTQLASVIGIDPSFYRDYGYERQNATVEIRHKPLHQVARRVGYALPDGRMKHGLKQLYLTIQRGRTETQEREEHQATLLRLDDRFEAPNRRLGKLTGLDLSGWQR